MNEFTIDADKRLIKPATDPLILFDEDPLLMLQAIRLVSESGFDIHGGIYDAILKKEGLLSKAGTDAVREEFEAIITAEHAGKGLKMLAGTGLIRHIIGDGIAGNLSKYARDEFVGLAENIDKTKKNKERRLGLFYLCFGRGEAMEAIKFLDFSPEMKDLLRDAVTLTEKLNFLANTFEIKQFIVRYGADRFEYLHNLSKAKRIVYDLDDYKIRSRNFLLDYIEENGEPVFIEDMDIDIYDIINSGIANEEKAEEILSMLLDLVHKDPRKNKKDVLLSYAGQYAKNPVQAAFRKVRWLK